MDHILLAAGHEGSATMHSHKKTPLSELEIRILRLVAQGLTDKSIVFFNLENYDINNSSCRIAVRAFIRAWAANLHNRGYKAGVYGLSTNAPEDWYYTSDPNQRIDTAWLAYWNGVPSVWNLPGVPNSVLTNRFHQYDGDVGESWGGYFLNIDRNCGHGTVANWGHQNIDPQCG